MEIGQNTDALASASSTALTDQSLEFFAVGLDNQVVARALYKQEAGEALDGFETSQLTRLEYMNFRIFENAFLQWRAGVITEAQWSGFRSACVFALTSQGGRAWWRTRRFAFTEEFRDFVELQEVRTTEET